MLFRTGFPGRQFPAGVGVAGSAPLVEYDFTKGVLPDSRMTFARASVATYFDVTGTMQTAAINTPRFDYDPVSHDALGYFNEATVTNSIKNSTMVGAVAGTPGTLPTGWTTALAGLSQQIVGTGVENGINYIDIRLSGTTNTTAFNLNFGAVTDIAAAASQNWSESFYIRLTAGSLANVTSVQAIQQYYDITPTFLNASILTFTMPTTGPLAGCRITHNNAPTVASTAYIYPYLKFNCASGVAIDLTFRIGAPQLELWQFATSFIPTTNAAVTRQFDDLRMTAYLPASVFSVFAEWAFEGMNNPNEHRIIGSAPSSAGPIYCAGNGAVGSGIYDGGPVAHTPNPPNGLRIYNCAASIYNFGVTAKSCLNGGAFSGLYTPGSTGFTAGTAIRFMAGGTNLEITNGWLKRFRWWNRVLSDGEMVSMTINGPSLDIGFIDPVGGLDPRVTLTRASNGTYIDITGKMQVAGNNAARFDHDVVSFTPLGLLIEEARTNSLLNSDTGLTPSNAVVQVGAAADIPYLKVGANIYKITWPFSPSGNGPYQVNIPMSVGTYVLSVYVWIPSTYDATVDGPLKIDADSGSYGSGGSIVITASDMSKRNQWQRITTVLTIGSGASAAFNFVVRRQIGGPQLGGQVCYVTCPQVEAGSFPTSYIPSGGAGATRAVDVASMPYSLIPAAAGAMCADLTFPQAFPSATFPQIFTASDGTVNNYVALFYTGTANSYRANVAVGGSGTFDTFGGLNAQYIPGAVAKHAVTWNGTNWIAETNPGNGPVTQVTGTGAVPTAMNKFNLGSNPVGGQQGIVYISRVRYWPRGLSASEMTAICR